MSEQLKFAPVKEMSYADAVSELESILQMMQSDECDIDSLAAYTRRSAELLKECRRRLVATEEELKTALSELEDK